MTLEARQTTTRCYVDSWGRRRCYRQNNWNSFGRWILLGMVLFFLVLLILLRVQSRRRRTRGLKPLYGTGWLGTNLPMQGRRNNNTQNNVNTYSNQHHEAGLGAPGGAQNAYYDPHKQHGHEQMGYANTTNYGGGLQQPQQTYQPPSGPPPGHHTGGDSYAPPPGPPPGYRS